MHLGRRYKFKEFFRWTRREAAYLVLWSLFVTLLIQVSDWTFLTIPTPILTIVGSALAIILRIQEPAMLRTVQRCPSTSGQLISSSLILANKLTSTVGTLDATESGPRLKGIFYRHFAWLTALRFYLRESRPGKTPSSPAMRDFSPPFRRRNYQSDVRDELRNFLSDTELQQVMAHPGDRESLHSSRAVRCA